MAHLQPECQSSNDLRLSCCTSIANDVSPSNNSLEEFFFGKFFFPFLFSRTERTRFCWCELRVERHADKQKKLSRLVHCCMIEFQPGFQSRNELRLSCCVSIANDDSVSNNSFGEFFFGEFFFPFLFTRTERTRFGWCGLVVERHAGQ
jgi:hypothetical protein